MGLRDELLSKEVLSTTTSVNNNTAAVVTITAPTRSDVATIYVTGFWISAQGAPSAPVSATLKDGSTVVVQLELPNSAFAPIRGSYGGHPIRITPGNNAVLTLPAIGGTTVGTVTLDYFIGQL